MTYQAEVFVDTNRVYGTIDDRIYGQFIEHIGRVIYGGVYEPGSPLSDADGYRTDVLAAARELAPSVLRWPGGNFASGYHWRDGIGPAGERPTRRDLAWNAIENNSFGTEEFLTYCRMLETEPYINLNMGTGTCDEALQWLEYCNSDDDRVPEVELRRAGPHPEPHGVKIWGLGNEVYGWWQHGHTTAESYGEQAREWAKLLRWTDPSVKLIAVGAGDPDWNWKVLNQCVRVIDYLSLHCYWGGKQDPYHQLLAGPIRSEREIVEAFGMCSAARRRHAVTRPVTLCIDEWGVWNKTTPAAGFDQAKLVETGLSARAGIDTRFEEPYDLLDALVHASWLHVLWRHPERVTLATEAQMVNAIAPIHTTPTGVVKHTILYPLAIARRYAGSQSLNLMTRSSTEVEAPGTTSGSLPALDAGGTVDSRSGRLHLSLVNRSRTDECELKIYAPAPASQARLLRLWDEDPFAGNTPESPGRVVPTEHKLEDDLQLILPPHSHTTVLVGG